jgi:translocator protein
MKLSKKILYIITPLIGGSIVGLIINKSIDYNYLVNPPLSPPSYLFPVVWSILYILIGIAYYIYRKNNNDDYLTIKLYYIQLIFNYLWSIIFFILKLRILAVIWIIMLTIIIVYLMIRFYKEERISFYLFIPYILWVLFATYLNIGVVILN